MNTEFIFHTPINTPAQEKQTRAWWSKRVSK